MTDNEKKFTLRLPEELHAELVRMATADERSLHSMVVKILREAVAQHPKELDGPWAQATPA